ncbi:F-box/kelch-repeat protein At1g57790-like [Phoenix dactylifera]|uniref:F-box/kelch-repeat protein At1g57790-like n=1 Tax=Phoenix dactylifera TaxID=42345 RepID=A0A8B8JB89_PHODC|nr:F-box/kelch-repeat protein At1g57790-like [Phoenix dactylifera]
MKPSDLSPQLPWLLLQHDPDSDARPFYCLLSKMIHILYLPEAQGKWIVGSKHGWLILVEAESSVMTLLNPITRNIFILPNSSFTSDQVRRTTISSPPTSPTGCTVMVLLHDAPFVIYCSLFGNRWGQWVTINTKLPFDNFGAYDVIFHHKKFYVINDNLLLTIIDVATLVPTVSRVESIELPSKGDGWMVKRAYLTESEDDLLLNVFFGRSEYKEVNKDYFHQDIFHSRDFFNVFKLDESR